MNMSNFARLKELFRRAAAGQELTIAFLGGSITQGSLSTQPGNAYAFRVYQWFVDTFPQSKFHYVNGGIGGTSSHYGVARAVTDVLMYQPDFVAVDFSVNDLEVPFRQETYEGVVRKLLAWPSHPAVVLLNGLLSAVGPWWAVQLPLEVAAIAVEGFCYDRCGENIRRPYLLALTANCVSYGMGLALNVIF